MVENEVKEEAVKEIPKTETLVDKAIRVSEDLKKTLSEVETKKAELEQLTTRQILGGQSDAGSIGAAPEKTEVQKAQEEAEAFIKNFRG